MREHLTRDVFRRVAGGRKIVVVGVGVALVVLVQRLATGDSMYGALWRGLALGLLTLAFLGVVQRFWRGAMLKKASAAGTSVEFEEKASRFGVVTGRSLRVLEDRLDAQMRALSERLLIVEQAVAKSPKPDQDERE